MIEPLVELRRHHRRHRPCQEEEREPEPSAPLLAGEGERDRDAQQELERDRERGEGRRRAGGAPEARVHREEREIVEPGEARHAEDRDAVLEREPHHPASRVDRERSERHERGRQQQEGLPPGRARAPGHRSASRKWESRRRASPIARAPRGPPASPGSGAIPTRPRTGESRAWNRSIAYGQFRRNTARPSPKARRESSSSAAGVQAGLTPDAMSPRRNPRASAARPGSGKRVPSSASSRVPFAQNASRTFTTRDRKSTRLNSSHTVISY